MHGLILATKCNDDVMHSRETLERFLKQIVMDGAKVRKSDAEKLLNDVDFSVLAVSPHQRPTKRFLKPWLGKARINVHSTPRKLSTGGVSGALPTWVTTSSWTTSCMDVVTSGGRGRDEGSFLSTSSSRLTAAATATSAPFSTGRTARRSSLSHLVPLRLS